MKKIKLIAIMALVILCSGLNTLKSERTVVDLNSVDMLNSGNSESWDNIFTQYGSNSFTFTNATLGTFTINWNQNSDGSISNCTLSGPNGYISYIGQGSGDTFTFYGEYGSYQNIETTITSGVGSNTEITQQW